MFEDFNNTDVGMPIEERIEIIKSVLPCRDFGELRKKNIEHYERLVKEGKLITFCSPEADMHLVAVGVAYGYPIDIERAEKSYYPVAACIKEYRRFFENHPEQRKSVEEVFRLMKKSGIQNCLRTYNIDKETLGRIEI